VDSCYSFFAKIALHTHGGDIGRRQIPFFPFREAGSITTERGTGLANKLLAENRCFRRSLMKNKRS
jgi:hypothetical protein